MKAILRFELRRAFVNRAYFLALGVGIGICLWHIIFGVIPRFNEYSFFYEQAIASSGATYPISLFNTWVALGGGQVGSLVRNLYFFILPLLICIPFVGSYYSDRAHGYAINVVTRVKASHYYCAKLLTIFLTAASIAVIPLIFSLLATALFIPAVIPELTSSQFVIRGSAMWSDIFYKAPLLYCAMYLVLIAVFSGLIALLGAVIAHYVGNVVFCLLAPFVVYTFSAFLLGALRLSQYSFSSFLRPEQPLPAEGLAVFLTFAILVAGFGAFFYFKIRKDELY